MILPCQGEATGFSSDKERDQFGLHLLAQIRYHEVMVRGEFDYLNFERVKQITEDLADAIRKDGANEAILDGR